MPRDKEDEAILEVLPEYEQFRKSVRNCWDF